MVPRLAFHEWEGFNAGESAQQMTAASRAWWPGLTLLTLADIKTAAWLVENNHLTHLERITFTTDLHTQSVSTEVETIKRVAGTVSTKSDDQIFAKVKGIILTTFYYSTPDKSIFISKDASKKIFHMLYQVEYNVVCSVYVWIIFCNIDTLEIFQTCPSNCPVTVTDNQISLDISGLTGYEMNSQSSLPVCLR